MLYCRYLAFRHLWMMCIDQAFQRKRAAGLYSSGEQLVLEDPDPTM